MLQSTVSSWQPVQVVRWSLQLHHLVCTATVRCGSRAVQCSNCKESARGVGASSKGDRHGAADGVYQWVCVGALVRQSFGDDSFVMVAWICHRPRHSAHASSRVARCCNFGCCEMLCLCCGTRVEPRCALLRVWLLCLLGVQLQPGPRFEMWPGGCELFSGSPPDMHTEYFESHT